MATESNRNAVTEKLKKETKLQNVPKREKNVCLLKCKQTKGEKSERKVVSIIV